MQYAHNVKPMHGYTDIFIHSNPKNFGVLHNGKWVKLGHRDLANFINSKGIKGDIRLIACNAGLCDLSQNLANKLNVNVLGATTKVGVSMERLMDPVLEKGGQWIRCTPGGGR
ncbi:MAG: hypothetical protein R3C11_27215 [Planctomycetaceae bacterium]